jgi:hypothetical protein
VSERTHKKTKPTLHVAGSVNGPPTLDDLIAMVRKLTGREPTAEEIAPARKILADE